MKKSTISAIAAVSAAGVVALSLGAVSDWYKNWDTKTWFNYWGKGAPTVEEPVTPDTPDDPNTPDDPSKPSEPVTPVDSDKGGAIVTDGENNGMQIKTAKLPRAAYAANGVSAQAESAYVLTASIQPSDATNKDVTFTAAWSNPNSAWASGKTLSDYVTVTQSSAGSRSATIECKQAFGERVIVTCTSEDNNTISASCNVDYEKKFVGLGDVSLVDYGSRAAYLLLKSDGTTSGGVPIPKYSSVTCDGVFDIQYSTYTIDKDYTAQIGITLDVLNTKNSRINSSFCVGGNSSCMSGNCSHYVYGSNLADDIYFTAYRTFKLDSIRTTYIKPSHGSTWTDSELRSLYDCFKFTVYVRIRDNSTTVFNKAYDNVGFNSGLTGVDVQNVTLDNSNIIF